MARFLTLLVLSLALVPATAMAAAGDLDRSFGNAGIGIFDWGGTSSATGILVQPDGQAIKLAGSAGASDSAVAKNGDAGRVIAAIFEPSQSL